MHDRPTLQALATPRRAIPIASVCAALIAVDAYYTSDLRVLISSVSMCALFVLLAPASWRTLFPPPPRRSPPKGRPFLKALLYAGLSIGCVMLTGKLLPKLLSLPVSFMTDTGSLLIAVALFMAGGWGLGRDIDLEYSLTEARSEAERLQLLALDRHLDPHFLFNTLGAIAEWHHESPQTAEEATQRLANMLRKIVVAVKSPSWSLEQELALVEDLLQLHLVRSPDRFSIERTIDPELLPAQLPPMLILSLAENALKHGPLKGHQGPITLRAQSASQGTLICIEVGNPGVYNGPRPGGEGLDMTERRLRLFFGERRAGLARFQMETQGDRTLAKLRLPRLQAE